METGNINSNGRIQWEVTGSATISTPMTYHITAASSVLVSSVCGYRSRSGEVWEIQILEKTVGSIPWRQICLPY
jgi:hypothetical protein